MAGRWIEEAERRVSCARCKARVEPGQRFWYARRGTYMCELCGSMAEHEEPEVGEHESGALEDLKRLPPDAAGGTLAKLMIGLARKLDSTDTADRDYPVMTKELRQVLVQLRDQFPPEEEDDDTAKARKRRVRMMMLNGDYDDD